MCTLPNSGTDGDGALLLLQSHQIYQFLPNCCESKMKNSKLLLFLSLFLGIGTGMIYELQCAAVWSKYLQKSPFGAAVVPLACAKAKLMLPCPANA